MKAGTVVIANFSGANGIKRRPALIVSTALYHTECPDVILTVITSQIAKANTEFDYVLRDWQSAGLKQPSVMRVYLGMKMPSELMEIGELSARDWMEVQKKLQIALAIK
ncbi:MAG: type II toxin-antitoxin system PemK/MazF family toxin [Acidobacteriota bacterium]|nr:type II toxin-antitoxin system PemK/MazF family toxin [Acidobacteriota bacterium]